MSLANSTTRITELDYLQIRENLKTFLRGQAEFTDFDFEGSGMAVLLDLLAYNTHYMGYYLNMVGSEMFLDSAQLRNNILSRAKELNYVPRSMKAAEARVNIKVTPGPLEDNSVQTITLDKFTNFLSESNDGVNYNFVTLNSLTTTKTGNGTFEFSNVSLYQGEVITNQFLVNHGTNPKRMYTIPNANCDTSTISVLVQESTTNTALSNFTLSNDLTEVTGNSAIFYLQESSDANNTYNLQFGDGVLGKKLSNGNIVIVTYLSTDGAAANKLDSFVLSDTISGFSANVEITSTMESSGGAEKETIEEIRYRAPIHYTIQNRAVTKKDYESLILKDYPNIRSVAIWGGDESEDPVYGKIFISLAPVDNYAISLAEKERIKEEIISTRSVLTVFPEFIDPDYTYLQLKVDVSYNPSLTAYDSGEIQNLTRAAILDYKTSNLDTFNSVYRESRLHSLIEDIDSSVTSSSIVTYLQKRIKPTLGISQNYTIKFNQNLHNQFSSYPSVTVTDLQGIDRQVFFEEIPESDTGVDYIEVTNSGENYTDVPTVTITGDGIGATAVARIVNRRINSIEITNRGSNYTRATVTITGGGGNGGAASAVLESKNGILRTFYYKPNGEKVIVNNNAGTIDHVTGIVQLFDFNPVSISSNPFYANDTLTFSVLPEKQIIYPVRNQILTLDENDSSSIQVTVIAE